MKKLAWYILVLALLCSLLGCVNSDNKIPDEGVWYCDELKIKLDFNAGYATVADNNEEIICNIGNERGTNYVSVLNQDFGSSEYSVGESVFFGVCEEISNDTMIITDYYTQIPYTFILLSNQGD